MARLAHRSTVVQELLPSDLPHLEDFIRRSGAEQNMTLSAGKEGEEGAIRLPGEETKITRWGLVRNLWRGRGMTVFISKKRIPMFAPQIADNSAHNGIAVDLHKLPASLVDARDHLDVRQPGLGHGVRPFDVLGDVHRPKRRMHRPGLLLVGCRLFRDSSSQLRAGPGRATCFTCQSRWPCRPWSVVLAQITNAAHV